MDANNCHDSDSESVVNSISSSQ